MKEILYYKDAKSILLAAALHLCLDINKLTVAKPGQVPEDFDEQFADLLGSERAAARDGRRLPAITRIPTLYSLIDVRPGLRECIEVFCWDLSNTDTLLYVQNAILDNSSVEAQKLLGDALVVSRYLSARSALWESDGGPTGDVEPPAEEAEKTTKEKYLDIINDDKEEKPATTKEKLKEIGEKTKKK